MIKTGIHIEVHHHEVATAGQCEIDMKFDSLVRMGDKMMWYKYIVKNIAKKHNKVATFMPKPIFEDNGSGMHVHQSLFKDSKNIFFDPKGYALISQTAKYYIGGLIRHAASLSALVAPTTNSYRRLVPGFEAPVNLVYSARNRSACVRIPVYTDNPRTKRIEYRPPDNSCNGYLALAAMLMAGLDGIENQIDPGEPLDKDSYHLTPEEAARIQTVPSSLEEALDALEKDHDYLLKGDVFTPDVIKVWLDYKRSKEVDALRLRPHPYEFHLYFDI
jgi:glutamine synthetase